MQRALAVQLFEEKAASGPYVLDETSWGCGCGGCRLKALAESSLFRCITENKEVWCGVIV